MARVMVTVAVNTSEHSFVETAEQARALVENILQRAPQYHTTGMEVTVANGGRSGSHRDINEGTDGDEVLNIFERMRNERSNNPDRHRPS